MNSCLSILTWMLTFEVQRSGITQSSVFSIYFAWFFGQDILIFATLHQFSLYIWKCFALTNDSFASHMKWLCIQGFVFLVVEYNNKSRQTREKKIVSVFSFFLLKWIKIRIYERDTSYNKSDLRFGDRWLEYHKRSWRHLRTSFTTDVWVEIHLVYTWYSMP